MITNFLLDHSAMVPVVLLLVAAVSVGVGYVVVRRRPTGRALWALALASLLPIVALTLVPTGVRMDQVICAVQLYMPTLGRLEMLANVALFVPPAYFAALATRRPLLIVLAGVTLSAVIEALQALVPAIGRACDTNDWAMNTGGVVLGVLLSAATIALTRRTTSSKAVENTAETSSRTAGQNGRP